MLEARKHLAVADFSVTRFVKYFVNVLNYLEFFWLNQFGCNNWQTCTLDKLIFSCFFFLIVLNRNDNVFYVVFSSIGTWFHELCDQFDRNNINPWVRESLQSRHSEASNRICFMIKAMPFSKFSLLVISRIRELLLVVRLLIYRSQKSLDEVFSLFILNVFKSLFFKNVNFRNFFIIICRIFCVLKSCKLIFVIFNSLNSLFFD